MPTPFEWQKSSFSTEQANCVELAAVDGVIGVRESDTPEVAVTTTRACLGALIVGVKTGTFAHLTSP